MLQKTVGIVLHVLKYNDTSNIVEMYTELSGRASFLVTVPRSKKATVKSVLFHAFWGCTPTWTIIMRVTILIC